MMLAHAAPLEPRPVETPLAESWYADARGMCLDRIRDAHDPDSGLFARQIVNGRWTATQGTEDLTSTAACLIALSRIAADPPGIDPKRSLNAIFAGIRRKRYFGALGLALWANAVSAGIQGDAVLRQCGADERGLRRLMDDLTTMELSWLLSGLLHERHRGGAATEAAGDALAALEARQCDSALFVHAIGGSPRQRIRRNVATFADQIYAVQALAFAKLELGRDDALVAACRCADALLLLKGPLQQWWWHYDAQRGSVSRRYPVYAVHQHAMAPMAFQALERAGAHDYGRLAWPGLDWINCNESHVSLFDAGAGTIWRDLELDRGLLASRLCDAAEMIGAPWDDNDVAPRLRLNRETRPYEWAWCLLAGAQLTSAPPPPHLA